jgi:hypothetical protein
VNVTFALARRIDAQRVAGLGVWFLSPNQA